MPWLSLLDLPSKTLTFVKRNYGLGFSSAAAREVRLSCSARQAKTHVLATASMKYIFFSYRVRCPVLDTPIVIRVRRQLGLTKVMTRSRVNFPD